MVQHEYKGIDRVLHRHTLRGVESGAHCQVLTLHSNDAGEIEPKLWKGSVTSRVGEWVGKVFLRALTSERVKHPASTALCIFSMRDLPLKRGRGRDYRMNRPFETTLEASAPIL